MKKIEVAAFLRKVLSEVENLPEGFEERLVGLVPANRSVKIRELIEEVTRG